MKNIICLFAFIIVTVVLGSGCASTKEPPWHAITLEPKPNMPKVYWYNRVNPIWWFGNINTPNAPDWYEPSNSLREVMWHFRNPFSNFANYVIGVSDKKTTRYGRYPDRMANPNGGCNFAVTRWHFIFLPYFNYTSSDSRIRFYTGWRNRGSFGMKLNILSKENVRAEQEREKTRIIAREERLKSEQKQKEE